jgi:hypothetical protein
MSSLSCGLCGRAIDPGHHYMVTIISMAVDGPCPPMLLCEACGSGHTVADVLAAMVRHGQAREFTRQAQAEAEELTRDPGKCKERIQVGYGEYRFCSRNAKHEDGYCTQHHEQAEASRRFRENPPYKLADPHGLRSDPS